MRISEVALHVGVPISTIRYYEKNAIIPAPARQGRDRSFTPKDIRAIQFVRDAQELGLGLKEISTLINGAWGSGEMAKVAALHRQTVHARIKALRRVDKVLSSLEACQCRSFNDCELQAQPCKRDD